VNNELMLYSRGEAVPARRDRAVAREAKQLYDRARLQAMKADASLALAGHIMNGVVELDKLRHQLSDKDVFLEMILTDIEAVALKQVRRIQVDLTGLWEAR
jgi:hypothetical protein